MTNPAATAAARDEELRLALVMNGGVSLAVWMGGVAFEFNRLVGETHPVYRGLLELARTRARIDVISGTSAGGINGAALALACVHDTSLWPLRDVWLDAGSFEALLRDPAASEPPSLLDGDGVFLPALERGFGKLVAPWRVDPALAPIDLTLTATMLRGEPQARLDDFGERIEDTNHRAQFHFERSPQAGDPFAQAGVVGELARAARTSASFPVAFEPRFVAAGADHCESVAGGRPRPLARARFMVDGGVLDNKPIEGALRAIFNLPPRGNVRRVLAYVTPDPAVTARAGDDDAKAPPELAEVAVGSLITVTGAESIADQLDRIDAHNAAVLQRRDAVATLVANTSPTELEQMSELLFDAYRERRIDGLLDYVVQEIEKALARGDGPAPAAGFGRRTRDWLKAVWRSDPQAAHYWQARVPQRGDRWSFRLQPADGWTWGLYSIEFAQRLALELLRRAQRLRHLIGPAQQQPADEVAAAAATADWEALDQRLRAERAGRGAPALSEDEVLGPLWAGVFGVQRAIDDEWARSRGLFGRYVAGLMQPLAEAGRSDEARAQAARQWLAERLVANPEEQESPAQRIAARQRRHAELARRIAELLLALEAPLQEVLASPRRLRSDEEAARRELQRLHDLLFAARDETHLEAPPAGPAERLLRRVLQLEVVTYALAGREREQGSYVELVQVSAHGASPWGGGSTPQDKLAGMQLAHFGAFYRKSWRANDWMVGRLDGIDRLVRIALNPDRLHRLYGGSAGAVDTVLARLRRLAVDDAEPDARAKLDEAWNSAALREELAFLARADARVPETLPLASEALVRRLHLEVLRRELPDLARAVHDDILDGTSDRGPSAKLAQQIELSAGFGRALQWLQARWRERTTAGALSLPLPTWFAQRPAETRLGAADAIRLYAADEYRIGRERLTGEAGADALTRTASRTIVVAHAALAAKRSGLMQFAALLRPLRLPLRAFHLAADRLLRESRSSTAVTTAMLVCGVLFVLGAGLAPEDAPLTGVAAIGWSLLFGWTATALLRQRLTRLLAIVLIALLLLAALGLEKALLPIVAGVALFVLLGLSTWLGGAVLSLIVLWWSVGKPGWDDLAAACSFAWPLVECARAPASAAALLLVQLAVPLAIVIVLALLAKLVDGRGGPPRQTPSRR